MGSMGEYLVIRADLLEAAEMLKVLPDVGKFYWEWGPTALDVAARWLPKKGFKILPKFFDANYRPGTVGDEADKLIESVGGCTLRMEGQVGPIPIWNSAILELPEMREELKRILEEDVLDMSFEEEVAKVWGDRVDTLNFKAEKRLRDDNERLRDLARIITKLVECYDRIGNEREKEGMPRFVEFEFYIPRY
jgi:hypothetical protein